MAARLLDPEGDCELALTTVDGQVVGFASFAVVYPGPAARVGGSAGPSPRDRPSDSQAAGRWTLVADAARGMMADRP